MCVIHHLHVFVCTDDATAPTDSYALHEFGLPEKSVIKICT